VKFNIEAATNTRQMTRAGRLIHPQQ